jgi:putative phage-type endonuclease
MIAPDRFIARSSDREDWLKARTRGITATQVAKAASGPAGLKAELENIDFPLAVEVNDFMQWGTDREAEIAKQVKWETGIMPNDWLVSNVDEPWMLATPDGLSLDHNFSAEIKTVGEKTFAKWNGKIPILYRRQIQWQLHCAGSERAYFAAELRLGEPGAFVPGFELEMTQWVERDPKMIADLVSVAHVLFAQTVKRNDSTYKGMNF